MIHGSTKSKQKQRGFENKHQRSHTDIDHTSRSPNRRVDDDERSPDRTVADATHNENAPIRLSDHLRDNRDNGTYADQLINELNEEP